MKPVDLVYSPIRPTQINSYLITSIAVDLRHINYGLDPIKGYGNKRRSDFKLEDIILCFESLKFLEINFEQEGDWEYFVVDKDFFGKRKKYRMVFCIDQKMPHNGGIITLFKIKKRES